MNGNNNFLDNRYKIIELPEENTTELLMYYMIDAETTKMRLIEFDKYDISTLPSDIKNVLLKLRLDINNGIKDLEPIKKEIKNVIKDLPINEQDKIISFFCDKNWDAIKYLQ